MTPIDLTSSPMGAKPPVPTDKRDAALFQAAQDLEASFLAEMLKSAGFGKPRDAYGGGIGEEQFGSFLRQEQAKEMVKQGGIGLAESLFEALKERADAE
ncbi:rod-binding protein [Profundibacter sp.]